MLNYIRILMLCTVAGYVLAILFMTPGGAEVGAVKGLVVGLLVALGEWKSRHNKPVPIRGARVA
jgi:hypothetical protein